MRETMSRYYPPGRHLGSPAYKARPAGDEGVLPFSFQPHLPKEDNALLIRPTSASGPATRCHHRVCYNTRRRSGHFMASKGLLYHQCNSRGSLMKGVA